MTPSMTTAMGLNDRDLIVALISQFFILDYGYISEINADNTVNVVHATKPVTTSGKVMEQMTTTNLEVLTLSGAGFSLNLKLAKGDKVLLLGLKNYIKKVDEADQAAELKCFLHYTRETMKVLPLCVFNSDAKVTVEIEEGTMVVNTEKKIELNGNDKQLVTWSELNQALSNFLTQLTTALTTTPIAGNGAPQPTWTGLPSTIDISAAKTTTVVTGG